MKYNRLTLVVLAFVLGCGSDWATGGLEGEWICIDRDEEKVWAVDTTQIVYAGGGNYESHVEGEANAWFADMALRFEAPDVLVDSSWTRDGKVGRFLIRNNNRLEGRGPHWGNTCTR